MIFLNGGGNFSTNACIHHSFVDNHDSPCLANALEHGLLIPWIQSSKIDQLHRDAQILLCLFDGVLA
ncbi:hypothetical protein LB505_011502, partial [Fusarium chuoi]